MYGYVYMTRNSVNGKVYFGQSVGQFRPRYFGSGTIVRKALAKYGKDKFSVDPVWEAESKNELDFFEKWFIQEYRAQFPGNIYNVAGGGSGRTGPITQEHRDAISRALSGRVFSDETKRRMSAARRRRPCMPDHVKQRLSTIFKGRPISQEQRDQISKTMTGRKYSAERIDKVRRALKGRPWTKAQRDARNNHTPERRAEISRNISAAKSGVRTAKLDVA